MNFTEPADQAKGAQKIWAPAENLVELMVNGIFIELPLVEAVQRQEDQFAPARGGGHKCSENSERCGE